MYNIIKFLANNRIFEVAFMRYLLITYLIHIIKVAFMSKYEYSINGANDTIKTNDISVKGKLAHTLNFIYLVSQIILALL